LTAIGCAQLAGAGLEDVSVTEKKGRLYTPKGNMRLDWLETFSTVVSGLTRSS